jgi:hypothetical protein
MLTTESDPRQSLSIGAAWPKQSASVESSASIAPRPTSEARRTEWIEWTILLAIVACTLEGALRKWALPRGSQLRYVAYFSKDLLLGLCLVYATRTRQNLFVARARRWILPGVALAVVGCAIATSGANLVGAVLTLRAAVVLPLLALTLAQKLPRDSLVRICRIIAALAVLNAILGVMQFFSPTSSTINRYAAESEYITTSGFNDRVRATGTFSYITGYGVFAEGAVAAGLILLSTASSTRWSNFAMAAVLCGLVCAATSVSRSVILVGISIPTVWLVLAKGRTRFAISALVLIGAGYGVINYFGLTSKAAEIITTTERRHQLVHDSIAFRILGPFIAIPQAIDMAPLGNGLGTEQVGGNYYASGKMTLTTIESDWARIIFEIGVIGFAGVVVTYAGVIGALWTARKTASDPKVKAILLVTTLICGAWFFTGVLFNHVSSFYFWVLISGALAMGNER